MRIFSVTDIMIGAMFLLSTIPACAGERKSEKNSEGPRYSADILKDREYALEALTTVKDYLQSNPSNRQGNAQAEEETSHHK